MLNLDLMERENPVSCAELQDLIIRAHINDQGELARVLLEGYNQEWANYCEEEEVDACFLTPQEADNLYFDRACKLWKNGFSTKLPADWKTQVEQERQEGSLPFGSWWDVEWAKGLQVHRALVQRICNYEVAYCIQRSRWFRSLLPSESTLLSEKEGGR